MLTGWQLFTPIFQYVENLGKLQIIGHLATTFLYMVIALVGWGCIAWLGFYIIGGWIELWLVAAYGMSVLPFMIFRYTAFLGWGILTAVAHAAIRMGLLAFLLSIIVPLLTGFIVTDGSDPGLDTALAALGVAGLLCYLCFRIDHLCSRITGSQPAYMGGGYVSMGRSAVALTAGTMSGSKAVGAAAGSAYGYVTMRSPRER
jgi:type IV secretory pathway TrbL component